MLNLTISSAPLSVLTWIVLSSLLGGMLSVCLAALFALSVRIAWVPMLVVLC